MVKPLLNKPYCPSWCGTDIQESFALERQRLAAVETDRLNSAFGVALGEALVDVAHALGSRWLVVLED